MKELEEEETSNAEQQLELEDEKSAVEAKAEQVDEEAQSQLNRTRAIGAILNETKKILEKKVVDGLSEMEETQRVLESKEMSLAEKEAKMKAAKERGKEIQTEVKDLEARVEEGEEALRTEKARGRKKEKKLIAKVRDFWIGYFGER